MPKKASPDSPEPLEAAGFGLLGDAVTTGDGVVFALPGLRSGLDPGRGSWTSCPLAVGALPGSTVLLLGAVGLFIDGAGSGGVGVAIFTGAIGGSEALGDSIAFGGSAALTGGLELVLRTGEGKIGGGDSSRSFMRTLPLVPGLVPALVSTVVGELPVATG